MNPITAIVYSFLLGLLHGILPDEHTWPITFSYAIGTGSGKQGMKAGFYFSLGLTIQFMIMSELAYLALAPFLLSAKVNKYVFIAVGIVMVAAGVLVLQKQQYLHFHFLGHHHDDVTNMETNIKVFGRKCESCEDGASAPPVKWAFIHGFVAGFSIGAFSLSIYTIAAPATGSAWIGFVPGLMFGFGTMLMLLVVGALFGLSLKWIGSLEEDDIRKIGSVTGGRTLFFGGFLFTAVGVLDVLGIDIEIRYVSDYTLITLFMIGVAVPAFVYTYKEVMKAKRQKQQQ